MPSIGDDPASLARETVAELRRLVDALDRRVPHLERLSEPAIARDAANLRQQAVDLIRQIENATSPR